MKIKFWGVRGSVPTPWAEAMKVGGNTSCVQVITDDPEQMIVLDAGTGIRMMSKELVAQNQHAPREIHLLLTHTHWDHIQGLPFFRLLNYPENHVHIYGADKPDKTLEQVLRDQMRYEYFPLSLDQVQAKLSFHPISEGEHEIAGVKVTAAEFKHPGGVFGYRLESQGQVLVYATDMEYTRDDLDENLIQFAQGADLLIYDAQYTLKELEYKTGWGHSSHLAAAQLAKQSQVKELYLFSHDPDHSDSELEVMEAEAQKTFSHTHLACEGVSVDLAQLLGVPSV